METPVVRLSDLELEKVYEPSEDSFLLIDALEKDLPILESTRPNLCLEIGSGSGVVLTALALAAKKSRWPSYFLAVDVNPDACKISKRTSESNGVGFDVVRMDLAGAFLAKNTFDVVIFNPPYVVTETQEIFDENLITRSWAGGKKGREVMDRLFKVVPRLLSQKGLFYLVLIHENDPEEVLEIFKNFKMTGQIVAERKIRGEHLYVMRFAKTRTIATNV